MYAAKSEHGKEEKSDDSFYSESSQSESEGREQMPEQSQQPGTEKMKRRSESRSLSPRPSKPYKDEVPRERKGDRAPWKGQWEWQDKPRKKKREV
eukprot:3301496-Karenia_brevis.AAC.1